MKKQPKLSRLSRLAPDLTTKTDLAKLMGTTLSKLYYRMDKLDIPDGDIQWGRKKVYSQQLVLELTSKWKGRI